MEEGAGAEPSPSGARPKKKSRKTYDLTAADRFWQKHKGRSVLLFEAVPAVSLLLFAATPVLLGLLLMVGGMRFIGR